MSAATLGSLVDVHEDAISLLTSARADAPHRPQAVYPWAFEGYTAQEIAEGILSNAGIDVPDGAA